MDVFFFSNIHINFFKIAGAATFIFDVGYIVLTHNSSQLGIMYAYISTKTLLQITSTHKSTIF